MMPATLERAPQVIAGEASELGPGAPLVPELRRGGVRQDRQDRHQDEIGEEHRHQEADQDGRLAHRMAQPIAPQPSRSLRAVSEGHAKAPEPRMPARHASQSSATYFLPTVTAVSTAGPGRAPSLSLLEAILE
jgi:hypothetical protein